MKPKQESVLGTLAVLGLAAIVAYLGPDRDDRRPNSASSRMPSDNKASVEDALAPGRGRRALSPRDIPLKGWKDICWRTYEQINEDRLLAVAAGVVFYGLLALFPAITALVSLYGLIADSRTVNDHIAFLGDFLPQGTFSIVEGQLRAYFQKATSNSGVPCWSVCCSQFGAPMGA
jgi:membrane protein